MDKRRRTHKSCRDEKGGGTFTHAAHRARAAVLAHIVPEARVGGARKHHHQLVRDAELRGVELRAPLRAQPRLLQQRVEHVVEELDPPRLVRERLALVPDHRR